MASPLHLKENNFQKNNGKTGALRDESKAGAAAREETGTPRSPGSEGSAQSRSFVTPHLKAIL